MGARVGVGVGGAERGAGAVERWVSASGRGVGINGGSVGNGGSDDVCVATLSNEKCFQKDAGDKASHSTNQVAIFAMNDKNKGWLAACGQDPCGSGRDGVEINYPGTVFG